MGSFTAASFYRPTMPPPVTAPGLAEVAQRMLDTGIVPEPLCSVWLQYGARVSRKADAPVLLGDDWDPEEEDDIEYDVRDGRLAAPAALALLRQHDRPVRRAYVSLGTLAPAVIEALARRNSPENDRALLLDTLSLSVGPVVLCNPRNDTYFRVGWVSAALSGDGYLFPWTPRDLTDRLLACPEVQQVMAICRAAWPVVPAAPSPKMAAARRTMGDLWVGDDYDAPLDWRWGITQSL